MAGSSYRTVARIAWLIPVSLALLTAHQARTAVDLAATLRDGQHVMAEVTRYERSDRKDVTLADVDLRMLLEDGSVLVKERLALPYSIAHRVDSDSLEVAVLRGARQEVVIVSIGATQQRIAAYNAAMSFVMFVIALAGVVAWNRMLARRGDPSQAAPAA